MSKKGLLEREDRIKKKELENKKLF